MSACGTMPLLVVAAVETDGGRRGRLVQLQRKLKQRGLKVHALREPRDPVVADCDVLLVSCKGKEVEALAEELERLWTRKWDRWYAGHREACHA